MAIILKYTVTLEINSLSGGTVTIFFVCLAIDNCECLQPWTPENHVKMTPKMHDLGRKLTGYKPE